MTSVLRPIEQMAGHGVAGRDLAQRRLLLRAARHDIGTARVEAAADGGLSGDGTSPRELDLLRLPARPGHQHGREQRLGVGMADVGEQRSRSAPARRSCRDTSPPYGRPCGARWRDRAPPAGRPRCPAPGCPSGGSSSGRGSTRRAPRPARRARSACGREASAAASATRWRWPPLNSCGYCCGLLGPQADLQQQLAHPRGDLRLVAPAVDDQRFGDGAAHLHARIERRPGILEHRLHLGAIGAQRLALQAVDRLALEQDAALGRRPRD